MIKISDFEKNIFRRCSTKFNTSRTGQKGTRDFFLKNQTVRKEFKTDCRTEKRTVNRSTQLTSQKY